MASCSSSASRSLSPAWRSTWSSDVDRRPRAGPPSCVTTHRTSPPWTCSLPQPLASVTPSPPTAHAACSTSSTTASACDIMTACEAPSIPCIRRKGGHIDQRFHALVAVDRVGDDRAAVGMTDENDRAVNRIEDGRYVGGIAAHTPQRVRSRDHLVSLGEQQFEDRFPVGQRLSECAVYQNYGHRARFSHRSNSLDQLAISSGRINAA